MTNSNDWDSRLCRIEALVESNAKSIQSLSNTMSDLADDVRVTQRQIRDILRRVDNNSDDVRDMTADIREISLENKRILRYLENRSQD